MPLSLMPLGCACPERRGDCGRCPCDPDNVMCVGRRGAADGGGFCRDSSLGRKPRACGQQPARPPALTARVPPAAASPLCAPLGKAGRQVLLEPSGFPYVHEKNTERRPP